MKTASFIQPGGPIQFCLVRNSFGTTDASQEFFVNFTITLRPEVSQTLDPNSCSLT